MLASGLPAFVAAHGAQRESNNMILPFAWLRADTERMVGGAQNSALPR
jgi:hypothetical protein